MKRQEIIEWLLQGDVSIQYQVQRDLLHAEKPELQRRIAKEGWGAALLAERQKDGYWSQKYYQPKWISTHYTLLELKYLRIDPQQPEIQQTLQRVFNDEKALDGGILPIGKTGCSDVCVNGMVLNFSSYFNVPEENLKSVIDCILEQQMPDGGFNCHSNTVGARHSSLHTTLSVTEGIHEFLSNNYSYKKEELAEVERQCRELMLQHRLYKSDHTGEIINKRFLMLSWPSRWFYDVLRALDYFRNAGAEYDNRMKDAIAVLIKKRKNDTWPLQAKHIGQVHFDMESTGKPSRCNTLRALRVLEHFNQDYYQ